MFQVMETKDEEIASLGELSLLTSLKNPCRLSSGFWCDGKEWRRLGLDKNLKFPKFRWESNKL